MVNFQRLEYRAAISPGARTYAVDIRGGTVGSLQWIQRAASGSVSAIDLFITAEPNVEALRTNDVYDFALPEWSPVLNDDEAPITFSSLPEAAIGSRFLPIADMAGCWLGVRLTVAVALTNFSLYAQVKRG